MYILEYEYFTDDGSCIWNSEEFETLKELIEDLIKLYPLISNSYSIYKKELL